jgi:hypothetical protein
VIVPNLGLAMVGPSRERSSSNETKGTMKTEHSTGQADARLIAAAPELLAACKAMVASYEAYDCIQDEDGKAHADYVMAKAAIAKAQGTEREGGV